MSAQIVSEEAAAIPTGASEVAAEGDIEVKGGGVEHGEREDKGEGESEGVKEDQTTTEGGGIMEERGAMESVVVNEAGGAADSSGLKIEGEQNEVKEGTEGDDVVARESVEKSEEVGVPQPSTEPSPQHQKETQKDKKAEKRAKKKSKHSRDTPSSPPKLKKRMSKSEGRSRQAGNKQLEAILLSAFQPYDSDGSGYLEAGTFWEVKGHACDHLYQHSLENLAVEIFYVL